MSSARAEDHDEGRLTSAFRSNRPSSKLVKTTLVDEITVSIRDRDVDDDRTRRFRRRRSSSRRRSSRRRRDTLSRRRGRSGWSFGRIVVVLGKIFDASPASREGVSIVDSGHRIDKSFEKGLATKNDSRRTSRLSKRLSRNEFTALDIPSRNVAIPDLIQYSVPTVPDCWEAMIRN